MFEEMDLIKYYFMMMRFACKFFGYYREVFC